MTHPPRDGDHRFSRHDPGAGHDTGGVPWQGRTLTGTGFDGDTGQADRRLGALLASPPGEREERDLVAAVAAARLLVPIVAVPSEVDDSSGIPVDAVSDMASVTLVAPDGQRALPVFTSTAALAAWNPDARPVPVTARRAALAAVQEGCQVIPVDLPGEPGPAACTLRPSMVWALASGRAWCPAHEDDVVREAVASAVAHEPSVLGHDLADGGQGTCEIHLVLASGLDREDVHALVTRIGQRVASEEQARTRVDALAFRLSG